MSYKEIPYTNDSLIDLLDEHSAENYFRNRFIPEDEEEKDEGEEDNVTVPSLYATCFHEAA